MYRKQISLCFILGLLICLTQAKARCLVYERELNLSADWENCKVQCTKERCVSWRYENQTNRCFGKMVEIVVSQEEHKATESSTDCTNLHRSAHSSTQFIEELDAEGSIGGNEKEEEDTIREIEIEDDEGKDSNEETAAEYYAQFYNTHIPVMRDDDDHADDNSDEQYDDYGTNVPKAASEERTPQEEMHAEYYNQFYNEDLSDTSD
eukprot:g466.t1